MTDEDLHLFNEGSHFRAYEKLGAHPVVAGSAEGCYFAVFAPNARSVTVMGDWNGWDKAGHPLRARGSSGIWEGVVPGVGAGAVYKYHVASRLRGYRADKADPYGFACEVPPRTGSVVAELDFEWSDSEWMASRRERHRPSSPVSIYEVHLGSWRRPWDSDRFLTYREIAPLLAQYAKEMGYTHVELLPVMEHPFYASWGYQVTGYFAPTARYGSPADFQFLVDALHREGIGVILDWVPSHFPSDEHGLGYFDGTHLYEHADPRQGFHPDWKSAIFNYGRAEVRSFLFSSAELWLEKYHADGLRVDAVASMLHWSYSRKAGEWVPNVFGGPENLEAISLLRRLDDYVREAHPDALMIAEESTTWPMVSRPTRIGGLGFDMKWDMGWMNDTLKYFKRDPIHRKYHHTELTFRPMYAYTESFLLPLSHDEVVHMKGSLLSRMPGDDWRKFANLRLLLAYQAAVPGKKLLFMGGEFGQWAEWNHDNALQWHLLSYSPHAGVQKLAAHLNRLYAGEPALHERDFDPSGFEWIDCHDWEYSTLSLLRRGGTPEETILAAFNFTPVTRHRYRIGAPASGFWREIANTDATEYGGSGVGNMGGLRTDDAPAHGRPWSLALTLPPLGAVFFKHEPEKPAPEVLSEKEASDETEKILRSAQDDGGE
ncbi:MAG TPA: 1,4-alpha-glucan branching protein GlgB [Thermoanaerobaculia bacterium]|nr:1,4-alpha-glucan branching protein GlgB [Thermoanaerobaculia bacterium]